MYELNGVETAENGVECIAGAIILKAFACIVTCLGMILLIIPEKYKKL